jgi:hypothetical protein
MLILMPAQLGGRTIQIHLRLLSSLAIFQEIGHDAPDYTRGKQRQRPGVSCFEKFSPRAEPRAFGALHYCSEYGESAPYGCRGTAISVRTVTTTIQRHTDHVRTATNRLAYQDIYYQDIYRRTLPGGVPGAN